MLNVKNDVLESTTKCGNGFSCLSGKRDCLCEPEDHFADRIIFIKSDNCGFCEYRLSFGNSFICTCPTRKEIYSRYNI